MLPAIDFDDQLSSMTGEIDDVAAEANLPAKVGCPQVKPVP
jgi:hypothetical protein